MLKTKNKIAIFIIIIVDFSIIFPLILEYCVFRNTIYSVLSNGEWSGFLGSFVGGIVSGLGTLVAVYFTTSETREIQKKSEKQNNIKECKDFTYNLSKVISDYMADISAYYYSNLKLQEINTNKSMLECQIMGYQSIIKSETQSIANEVYPTPELKNAASLRIEDAKQDIENAKYKIAEVDTEIGNISRQRLVATRCYYFLEINLRSITLASKLLKQLEYVQRESSTIYAPHWIDDQLELIMSLSRQFSEDYLNERLKI